MLDFVDFSRRIILTNDQLASVRERVGRVISQGKAVAILGWKDSNHSSFTRKLPKSSFLFYEFPPDRFGRNVEYFLITRFVKHSDVARLRNGDNVCNVILGNGQVKEILQSCELLLQNRVVEENDTVKVGSPLITGKPNSQEEHLLEFLTQPPKEIKTMSDIERFAIAFKEASILGLVSSKKLGELLKSLSIGKTPQQLIGLHWVTASAKDGVKKAHWYKAGPELERFLNKEVKVLPDSVSGRVEFLMSQEPSLLAEKEELEARLREISGTLALIEEAKVMFGKISNVVGSLKV